MKKGVKNFRTFVFLSLIIGIFLCIIQTLGYFSRFDGIFYGLNTSIDGTSPEHSEPFHGDEYDAFISYRREGGSDTARLIRSELIRRGIRSFLDVVDLGASHFDDRLLQAIEKASAFILILSPESLDQCGRPDDWLRREISHAISKDKNIIPILKEGFVFPEKETLPTDIAELPRYNCVPYSHAYFEAATDRVMGFLKGSG